MKDVAMAYMCYDEQWRQQQVADTVCLCTCMQVQLQGPMPHAAFAALQAAYTAACISTMKQDDNCIAQKSNM
jgi:hypothetical protein